MGKKRGSPIIPKIIALVLTSNMRNFVELVPKNPQKVSSHSPQIFPKDSRNPFPVLTLSPNFGDGEGDFRVSRPHLDTLVCVQNEKYASWVTLTPQLDRYCQGEAKVRIFNFKTKWLEFQRPSQTAPAEAKPRCVYSILKPLGQSCRCQVRLLPPRRSRGAYTQF